MRPRYDIDTPQVVPSKPSSAIKKQRKHPKPPEAPNKIEAMLHDPEKRKHVGPCCVSRDGTIRGEKKWGDGKGETPKALLSLTGASFMSAWAAARSWSARQKVRRAMTFSSMMLSGPRSRRWLHRRTLTDASK